MYDNNVIFVYKGVVNSDLVTSVLSIMEERLEEDQTSKKLSKKVFNVMVESLASAYSDETSSVRAKFDPTSVLTVKREDEAYVVTTGHFIQNDKVVGLKRALDKINSMSSEELKAYYQAILVGEPTAQHGEASLAMVDLSRKSKHKLVYQFKYITPEYTFFSLEARISKSSL